MKKFRKVIPALCMLLVSAIMLGSTTYAWFTMNDKVTAKGMNVQAKTDTKFLVISKTETLGSHTTLGTSQSSEDQKLTGTGGDNGAVFPCAKATEDNKPEGLQAGEWYTANSKVYDNSASLSSGTNENATNIKKIQTSDLGSYQIKYTFYIGVDKNTGSFTGTLAIKNTSSTAFANGAKAEVTVGSNTYTFDASNTQTTFSNVTLTNTSATMVTVILYVDGNDTNVKSSTEATAIKGELDLEFSIT